MDFNPYSTEDNQQKVRIIIATVAIAVIILGIAAWAIIAIVGSRNNVAVEQTEEVAVDDNTSSTIKESAPESNVPTTEGVKKTTSAQSTTISMPAQTTGTVPETGPEELLPLALVAGSAVTFVASSKLTKREA